MLKDFEWYFNDRLSITDGKVTYKFKVHRLGNLIVTSGGIVACDPLTSPEMKAFTFKAPKGRFPVEAAVASIKTDRRVAMARVIFKKGKVVTWEMACKPGQKLSALKPGFLYGYPVDSGTGCFMDDVAARELVKRMDKDPDYFEVLIAELEKVHVPTWGWMNLKLDKKTGANIVAFSSGWGDGFYPSYLGRNEEGELIQLVSDFGVVPESMPEE
jgi:hypothetical protein